MVFAALVIGGAIAGAVADTAFALTDTDAEDEGGTGPITGRQRDAAVQAKPAVEAAYNSRNDYQAKNPDLDVKLKQVLAAMHDTIAATTKADDANKSDVMNGISNVSQLLKDMQGILKDNPPTSTLPDPMPPLAQEMSDAFAAFNGFLQAFELPKGSN